ncbi:hypothetical protein [Actinomadura darangshiensis]|uniref:hypothetical protein n=1 Tax=Actinomadura darangshiensis TaxID=705336 RepID=UPI001A9CBB1E|nr:hypothetical protein [Actinomadura darangshiensis]
MSSSEGRDVYTVHARRWEHGWELEIESVGATQSHSLKDAELMARDYIRLALEVPADSFDLELVPDVGDGLTEEALQAKAETRAAEKARDNAAQHSREVARKLHDKGLRGKEIAIVLGVSTQRVSQLLKAGRNSTAHRQRSGRAGAHGKHSSSA